jgi:hypothetical protein
MFKLIEKHKHKTIQLIIMSKVVSFLIITAATISVIKFGYLPDPVAAITQPGCVIKGNISISTGRKLYHLPGMKDYGSTIIDQVKGERWFCTEPEAIANGWSKAPR